MIKQETIDEILAVAQIEEVVADFVPLKRRGQNWVGVCPFHDDRNPSMYVSPRLGIFNCFVCHTGGDAVKFVMKHEQLSYPEALRWLAQKYGVKIVEDERKEDLSEEEKLAESLFAINKFAEQYFVDQLLNTEEGRNIGLSYFKERGFSMKTIETYRLGYCPDGWDTFTQAALKSGFSLDNLILTGLTKKSDNGKIFDFYRGRVIFPIYDKLGKPVGFGGRILKKDEKTAKYFNSPESPVYHKSNVLYGYYQAQRAIKNKDNVFLVEGYTDVLSMVQAGIENVVATSGTAFPDGQIRLLKAKTNNVTVLRDGDTAGINAALKDINILLSNNFNVNVVLLPEGEDPDSFAKSHSDSEITDYLKDNATNFILFKAKVMAERAGNDPAKRAEMVKDIIQSIALINDEIAQQFYVKELAKVFDIEEKILNAELRKYVIKTYKEKVAKEIGQEINIKEDNLGVEKNTQTSFNKKDSLSVIEEIVILQILKYGTYEIDVEVYDENNAVKNIKKRLDQHVYDELTEEEISFQNPMFQFIYDEYAKIAVQNLSQDEIKQHFVNYPDEEVRKFCIEHLMIEDAVISPQWEKRFEVTTDSVSNSTYKLNQEVENSLLMFKYRYLEKFIAVLQTVLNEEQNDRIATQILRKLDLLNKRRKTIADMMSMVVTSK